MKWQGRRGSGNIEDRRSMGGGMGGGGGRMVGGGGLGLIAVVVVAYLLGFDLTPLLEEGIETGPIQGGQITEADQQAAQFVSVTLADTEQVWARIFETQLNAAYTPVTLVLFKGATRSACGGASAQSGPFYCPLDKKIYLDTDFFVTLSRRLGADGDFAAAYVVAHEVGHHVQDLLGTLAETTRVRQQSSATDSNRISVQVELQADCFSGVWARNAQELLDTLETGDMDEALNAASRIGDDVLMANAGQRPRPDAFTHGSAAQRQYWLERGFRSGELGDCDTFAEPDL